METVNKTLKENWSKEQFDSDTTASKNLDCYIDNLNSYKIKGNSKEELLKSIVSNYTLMNKRIQNAKASLQESQRKPKKRNTVPTKKPKLMQKLNMAFEFFI